MHKLIQRLPLVQRLWSSHAAWNLLGTLAARGGYAVFGIVVARQVGVEQFGLYNAVLLYAMMFIAVLGGSLATALTRTFAHHATSRAGLGSLLLRIALLAALLSGAIAWAAPLLGEVLWQKAVSVELILWCAPFIFLSLLSNACMGLLAAHEQFRALAWVQLANGLLLGLACCLPLFGVSLSLLFALIILNGSAALSLCGMLWALFNYTPTTTESPLPTNAVYPHIWQAFAPLALAALAVAPAHWLVVTMLLHHSNASEVALYAIALQWFQAAGLLPTALANVALPHQTRLWKSCQISKDFSLIKQDLKQQIRRNSLIMLPVLAICFAASPLLVHLYKLPQAHANWILMLGFSTTYLLGVQLPTANLLMAAGKFWWGLWMNFVWAGVYLCGAYLLLNHNQPVNALSASYALIIAYCWQCVAALFATTLIKQPLK